VFDDVPDLIIARNAGLRLMVSRAADSLFPTFVKRHELADYITFYQGGHHAVRELTDLLMGLSGASDETITNRFEFTTQYRKYLELRNKPGTIFYTNTDSVITEQTAVV
jgi:hypothetical protein